jgi:cell wall-associated NlpC family hydrolase
MHKAIVLLVLLVGIVSCKSSKRAKSNDNSISKVIIDRRTITLATEALGEVSSENAIHSTSENDGENMPTAYDIIDYAKQFEGVRYKYGGNTDKGMDCSGLVFESFRAYDIYLPRISRDMAKQGEKISLKQTHKGDLLFFKTRNRRNDINHVGLVVAIEDNAIKFIHATTSSGVIISSLNESYWKNAFAEVRRIL